MTPNTSVERIDALVRRSERIYDEIDQVVDGEVQHRRLLRMGITTLAVALRNGEPPERAGLRLLALDTSLPQLPSPLDALANTYADVTRGTFTRTGEPETDSRHAIHLLQLAVPYAREYYPHLQIGKVAAYCLGHDLPEAYVGDVQSLGMTKQQEKLKIADEARALVLFEQEYGSDWPEFVRLVLEYEALRDPESKFVKTFDKLDPGFTHFENNGRSLQRFTRTTFYKAVGETTARMERYASSFPDLMEDRVELTRRVADVSFEKEPSQ